MVQIGSKSELETKLVEAGDRLVVLDFYAAWCGPCKRIAPLLDEIAAKYKRNLVLLKVDVDEVKELVSEYSIEVMPTFVFKRRGVRLDTLIGVNEEKLETLIEKYLKRV